MPKRFDAIVVGAGAAGLMCAAMAGQRGARVLVLDHAGKAGRKILISGGGRCNFTNRFIAPERYLSANPHYCKSALSRFTPEDFLAIVDKHRIGWHERKHGQLFCDRSARDILTMLLEECRLGRVEIRLRTTIHRIAHRNRFEIISSRGRWESERVVVATGGLSIPKLGATPFGLRIAEQFGLGIVPPRPGLVPLCLTDRQRDRFAPLAGISLPVVVRCNGKAFHEAMLFTHRGLSGPAILQISSHWRAGDTLEIDLLPQRNALEGLQRQRQRQPARRLVTALAEWLPQRLAQRLAEEWGQNPRLEQLDMQRLQDCAEKLHNWRIRPAASEGYRKAEVTVGGVDTRALDSRTMAARHVPGLHFIGEVVDVTGELGGFNFHWAWASAHAAAVAIAEGL